MVQRLVPRTHECPHWTLWKRSNWHCINYFLFYIKVLKAMSTSKDHRLTLLSCSYIWVRVVVLLKLVVFQSCVTAHVKADWKHGHTVRLPRHRDLVGFFNVPVKALTKNVPVKALTHGFIPSNKTPWFAQQHKDASFAVSVDPIQVLCTIEQESKSH